MWTTHWKEQISRSTCSSVISHIHVPHPESPNRGASCISLLMHISRACQLSVKTPWREALSKAITLLYLITAGSPVKTTFLTVSWQLRMECAYVGGKRGRRGEDGWMFENICINMFTSSSFLQVTRMVQLQIALCIFFQCRFSFVWNHQFADFRPSS